MSLTPEERRRVLCEFNSTRVDYPQHATLHGLFERQVERSPNATAVVFEGRSLTYAELERRANRLARHLMDRGVGPETLVALCVHRSFEMIVGMLGVLKAGGAYLPVDTAYPPRRKGFMIADSGVRIALTTVGLRDSIEPGHAEVICLDGDWDEIARSSDARPDGGVTAESLAYVIYTSGSTGKPKGTMNTHRAVCNHQLWIQSAYRLTPEDAVLQKTPFTFDVSVWEIFWPILAGARLVIAQPGAHLDTAYIRDVVQREQVTVLHFVPSMLDLFLQERDVERCTSVRDVICSGEALPFELQERFFSRLDAELHNLYGPTEAAIHVAYWQCCRDDPRRFVPIGRPVANTRLHVLDDRLEPVPIGDVGELHIGGVQVARGYLNRPELTAERFIVDPFDDSPAARLYKTGDHARYYPDGTIEYLGRMDNQVKVRGFRIELGEIESVLAEHPTVSRAVVLAREDEPGEKRLVAYLTIDGDRHANVSELRRFVETSLPEYMVPAAFVVLEAFPLSANGKLDRTALQPPDERRPDLDTPFVPPRSDLEREIARRWCRILKLDQVGIDDRFFELGGSSLQAAQFINGMQEGLGERVYIVTVFEAPSVREFAALLEREYVASLPKLIPGYAPPSTRPSTSTTVARPPGRIDASAISRMKEFIPTRSAGHASSEARNPAALFILSPPRSGTTLLRVMLSGHPRLFGAAELQLLCFNTLRERRAAFTGKYSLWLEGTIRAVMETKGCGADEAKEIMRQYESRNYSTQEFYAVLQEWIGDRMLVDKSPGYACDPVALRKAEEEFQGSLYIHLVRHPYAMTRSFVNYHMDQVLFLHDHPFAPRELGELVWTISQQNILEFLRTVPPERQFRMRFEDLVRNPEPVLRDMCSRLGLEFHPDLLSPYKDTEKKMTDGIYRESTPMGDTHFLAHRRIDPTVADRWQREAEDDVLGDVTWNLAETLGYDRPPADSALPTQEEPRTALEARQALAERQRSIRRRHRGSGP